MDINNAKSILSSSVKNIHSRFGKVTIENIEAEVINQSCLEILKHRRSNTASNEMAIVNSFAAAASELFKEYDKGRAAFAGMGVMANVSWEGMWDHLRNYFQKTHGTSIDNVEVENLTFYSSKHSRYEQDKFISESEVGRIINLTFSEKRKSIMVSIEPSLSPKPGNIIKQENRKSIYAGTDPDYCFTVEFDDFEEVSGFSMELVNRRVKVVYFE